MSHRHPSTYHPSYAMSHALPPSSADTFYHPSASYHAQGTHHSYQAHSPSRSVPRPVGPVYPSKVSPFVSGRKRGRSTEEDRMALERPVLDARPTNHRRAVSMTTTGRPSTLPAIPTDPHPLWLSPDMASTSPPLFTHPFASCLLRSPLPVPPPSSSRRPPSRRESFSSTVRMAEPSSKNRIVQAPGHRSAFTQREYSQDVNPGQSPEQYPTYERNRTSVPGLMEFTNSAPRAISGLPQDSNFRHPYPSPPKSRSDRPGAHMFNHSPLSATTAPSGSSPLFVFSPGDLPLPLPSPSRRQLVDGSAHSRPLDSRLESSSKRRRTASHSSPPKSSSNPHSSTRATRPSASDRISRDSNKHRALPPLKPCSPPTSKSASFSADPPTLPPYKMTVPNKDAYAFSSAILLPASKAMTECATDHRYSYSLPQVNESRRRRPSNLNGCLNIGSGALDLTNERQSGHESPQDVCLPSFELLLNGIQEMRMREQSGGSTGMAVTDAIQ